MYALWDETVTPITYYIEFDGNAGTAARNVPERMEVQCGQRVAAIAILVLHGSLTHQN